MKTINTDSIMKKIFVIMPFVKANDRDQASLTKFFTDYIKEPIEGCSKFTHKYKVIRSGDAFSILDKIIADLASADIVICDLSGELSNPNVVYELGIRLNQLRTERSPALGVAPAAGHPVMASWISAA